MGKSHYVTYEIWWQPQQNKAQQNKAQQNKAQQNKAQQNKAQQNKAQQNKAQQNKAQQNKAQQNKAQQNSVYILWDILRNTTKSQNKTLVKVTKLKNLPKFLFFLSKKKKSIRCTPPEVAW